MLVDGQATIHLEARYEARNLASSVLWVELRLLDSIFALKSCNYVEANRKFMQFLKKCATFEGYQRIAENDIMESKRKNYRRIVNIRAIVVYVNN